MSEFLSRVDIPVTSGDGFTGLLCKPTGPSKGAILLIQEIFGINENIRATARMFADKGYHVLVPDLFWRMTRMLDLNPAVEADRTMAMGFNQRFDDVAGLGDLRDAVAALKSLAQTEDVASVGYCLGGRLSFALGAEGGVSAAVSYYGVALHKYFGAVHRARTLVHVAKEDAMCPEPAQQAILDYAARSPSVQVAIHPGVGHAFSRLGSPAYVASTAEAAMTLTEAFLSAGH